MKTKKFINNPQNVTMELLEGLEMAFPDMLELKGTSRRLVVNRKLGAHKRVGVVSLGGSGHEPALSGYVGEGMLDISVVGDIFAAPGPQDVLEAIRLADSGMGVLLVVLNHAGDVMTSNVVMRIAKEENLNVKRIIVCDDISRYPRSEAHERRGMVAGIMLHHIAGAAAMKGYSLEEVANVAERFNSSAVTISVANIGATHPMTGLPISTFKNDEMELGVGQHGEGGGKRLNMMSADAIAELMLDMLINDLSLKANENAMLVINGAGATSLMEMCIVFRKAASLLRERGIVLEASYCGEILTTQEQAGFQMMLARMDCELLDLWKTPCKTPYYSR